MLVPQGCRADAMCAVSAGAEKLVSSICVRARAPSVLYHTYVEERPDRVARSSIHILNNKYYNIYCIYIYRWYNVFVVYTYRI